MTLLKFSIFVNKNQKQNVYFDIYFQIIKLRINVTLNLIITIKYLHLL